jgi:ribonuclease P/MRP protein subunit POP1
MSRYIKGNRSGSTNLYEYLGYPTKLICPISFLWKPKTKDTIWLWIHPASFNEALTFIKKAIQETKATNIQLTDLRDQILRFELTGPRSTPLLQSILDPVSDNSVGNSVWKDLSQLRSSCSLSPGSVIGLVVQDPRLKFPQKVPPRNNDIPVEEQQKIQRILDQWPADTADTSIWDADLRKSLFKNKIPEYGLNLRRQKNLVPGTKLQMTAEDSQIPLLLIQRGGPTFNKSGIRQQPLSSHELIEGWTVIIPRGFGLAFWKSLVFAGARVAGYDDVRAMHFESGFPCFPQDYPGTRAFEVNRQLVKKAAQAIWEKRPPAKRVNYIKRGVDHPFECAFETLSTIDHMEVESQCNLAVRPTSALMLGEKLVSSLLSTTDESAYQSTVNALLRNRQLNIQLPLLQIDDALIKVRAKYIDRGKPSANAMVFVLEDLDEYNQCIFHLRHQSPLKNSKRKLKELLEIQTELQKV